MSLEFYLQRQNIWKVLFALSKHQKVLFALPKHLKWFYLSRLYISLSRAMTDDCDQFTDGTILLALSIIHQMGADQMCAFQLAWLRQKPWLAMPTSFLLF
jgi:hypothetical protein